MIRISLIGPGNIKGHYFNFLRIKPKKFQKEIYKIAKALAKSNSEIELLPDKGVSFEIAKKYKKIGGKKVIGTFPKSDKRYGVKHIKPYLDKKMFDEFIDTKDWRDQNRLKALFGDAVLFLGISSGTFLELNYALYIYKLIKGIKKGLKAKGLQKEIKAGSKIPYTIFIYQPFLKNKRLPKEIEFYAKKHKINLMYIKSSKQLEKELRKLN